MRAVAAAAGQVTDLSPQTHVQPKPIVRAAADYVPERPPSDLVPRGRRRDLATEPDSERTTGSAIEERA